MAYCKVEFNSGYTIVSNELMRDKRLSLKAKGLQAMILSLPPDWDMTIEGLSSICRECADTISSILKELEAAGYLSRYRERNSNGRYGQMQYTFFQSPLHNKPVRSPPDRKNSGLVNPVQDNSGQLSKEKSNKDRSNKDCFDILSVNQPDAMDEMRIYKAIIHENVDYEILREQINDERLDEIVEIMLECICSTSKSLIIGKEAVPKEVVKSRFLKINSSHIEYVLNSLDSNTTKVRNIKSYLKTVLYNAPATINSYYAAEVNHETHISGNYGAKMPYLAILTSSANEASRFGSLS